MKKFILHQIGVVESPLKDKHIAPRQGIEGAPDAWIQIAPGFRDAMVGLREGQKIVILAWLHESAREVMQVHPRNEVSNPLTGVFATRSPDRPNPIGLHEVTVLSIAGSRLRVGPLEAIDGTPVVDIKPVI